MNENVLIICESMYHGNTYKLVIAIAKRRTKKTSLYSE